MKFNKFPIIFKTSLFCLAIYFAVWMIFYMVHPEKTMVYDGKVIGSIEWVNVAPGEASKDESGQAITFSVPKFKYETQYGKIIYFNQIPPSKIYRCKGCGSYHQGRPEFMKDYIASSGKLLSCGKKKYVFQHEQLKQGNVYIENNWRTWWVYSIWLICAAGAFCMFTFIPCCTKSYCWQSCPLALYCGAKERTYYSYEWINAQFFIKKWVWKFIGYNPKDVDDYAAFVDSQNHVGSRPILRKKDLIDYIEHKHEVDS